MLPNSLFVTWRWRKVEHERKNMRQQQSFTPMFKLIKYTWRSELQKTFKVNITENPWLLMVRTVRWSLWIVIKYLARKPKMRYKCMSNVFMYVHLYWIFIDGREQDEDGVKKFGIALVAQCPSLPLQLLTQPSIRQFCMHTMWQSTFVLRFQSLFEKCLQKFLSSWFANWLSETNDGHFKEISGVLLNNFSSKLQLFCPVVLSLPSCTIVT